MRIPTLIILRQKHEWLYEGSRCLVPTSDLRPYLVTHGEGGVDGIDTRMFPDTYVCDLQEQGHWEQICDWLVRKEAIQRVVAPNERFVLLASALRSKYGLPGLQHSTAILFRDKVLMKAVAAQAGLAVPDFMALESPDHLEELDWSTGPKVIKRRDYVGSMDVHVVNSAPHARQVWASLETVPDRYQVESFINGDMYHCDAITQSGVQTFTSVGRYIERPGDFRPGGTAGSIIVRDRSLTDRIAGFNSALLAQLSFDDGVTHLELFHTPDDQLVLCEVAARPGGAEIARLIKHAFGVNLAEAAIRLEAGLSFPLDRPMPSSEQVYARVCFFPDGQRIPGVHPRRFKEFGIVDHVHNPTAGGHARLPRLSADFSCCYILASPTEAEIMEHIERLRHECFES